MGILTCIVRVWDLTPNGSGTMKNQTMRTQKLYVLHLTLLFKCTIARLRNLPVVCWRPSSVNANKEALGFMLIRTIPNFF